MATLLGGDAPAELDGDVLPPEMARRLARAFAGQQPVADTSQPEPGVPWREAEQVELAAVTGPPPY